ncbi:MAG: hypothetical protein NVSMB10_06450 [Steroidobacteraceae bacterium]
MQGLVDEVVEFRGTEKCPPIAGDVLIFEKNLGGTADSGRRGRRGRDRFQGVSIRPWRGGSMKIGSDTA